MRQRSRAFIIADPTNSTNRVVFINAGLLFVIHLVSRPTSILCLLQLDIAMGDTGIRRSIVSQLSSMFPGVYTNTNIALVGTHQHSGVGGYLENLLPQLTALGYVKETADAIVQGSVRAVVQAHNSLAEGQLSLGNTSIVDGNINRSPSAYLANPAEERAM
jgi:neutral ceramidase